MKIHIAIQPRLECPCRADGAVVFTVPTCIASTAGSFVDRFTSTRADVYSMAIRTGFASAGSIGLVAPQHLDCWDGATTRVVIGPAQ
jgi:hypothetical protein